MSVSSISSVPPSTPVKPPEPVEAKAPEVSADTDSAAAYQPPAPSPLPPGQGTRVDQLV